MTMTRRLILGLLPGLALAVLAPTMPSGAGDREGCVVVVNDSPATFDVELPTVTSGVWRVGAGDVARLTNNGYEVQADAGTILVVTNAKSHSEVVHASLGSIPQGVLYLSMPTCKAGAGWRVHL